MQQRIAANNLWYRVMWIVAIAQSVDTAEPRYAGTIKYAVRQGHIVRACVEVCANIRQRLMRGGESIANSRLQLSAATAMTNDRKVVSIALNVQKNTRQLFNDGCADSQLSQADLCD